jgi:aprataxin
MMSRRPKATLRKIDRAISPRTIDHRNPQYEGRADPHTARGSRDELLDYILNPEEPRGISTVIYSNDNWVLIKDAYPKACLHWLLLPRDPDYYTLHPFHAFEDEAFLAAARTETRKVLDIAASELRRLHGRFSAADKSRIEAINSATSDENIPPGRDWLKELRAGVHAYPSMSHLHIHILSKDMHSPRVKNRKHYSSFNTPFFVPLDDFPLPKDDRRWNPSREEYLKRDLKCWRCGRMFGNRFQALKDHLDGEFKEWRAE